MSILTPANVFRRYDVDGVPDSGPHDPKKAEVIQLLERMQQQGGAVVSRATLTQLQTVVPTAGTFPRGEVLSGADAGWYAWSGTVWEFERGFPDTLARLTVVGGTADVVQASALPGVDPGEVLAFYIDVSTPNEGPITVSINGGAALPALNINGDPFAVGEWSGRLFLSNEGDHLRALNDAAAAQSAADSAAEAAANLSTFKEGYLGRFVNDAAVSAAAGTPLEGQLYWNITSKAFRYWDGDSWETIPFATVADGAITSAKLAGGAVTAEKMGDDLVPIYLTVTALQAATVRVGTKTVRVAGYAAQDDGGAHQRKRVAVQPTHGGGVRSADRFLPNGTTDATNGGWWDVDEAQPNERMFGGVPSRTNAQRTAAIQALLNYCGQTRYVANIVGGHTITSKLIIPAYVTVQGRSTAVGVDADAQYLQLGYNGDMFDVGPCVHVHGLGMRGNGATFTGRGFYVNDGNDQLFENCVVMGFASPCLEYLSGKGIRAIIHGGLWQRQTATQPAIVYPVTDTSSTDRDIVNVRTGGGTLANMGGCDNAGIINCDCATIVFTATSKKVRVIGCRIANGAVPVTFTLLGSDHTVTANIFSGVYVNSAVNSQGAGNVFPP